MTSNGVKSQGMAAYVAPSMFQPHRAREAIRDAHKKKIPPILGYYAGLSSIPITRWLAPFGFDSVWIDWEHTSCNVETMTTMVHETIFMSQGRTIPFVRVPGHDHAAIGFALDAGASIVVPQVSLVFSRILPTRIHPTNGAVRLKPWSKPSMWSLPANSERSTMELGLHPLSGLCLV